MKCRYFCRLPLDISPVYLTRGISELISAGCFFRKISQNLYWYERLAIDESVCEFCNVGGPSGSAFRG